MARPKLLAFDMFGTLASNEFDEWEASFFTIVDEQHLNVHAPTLHQEWRKYESQFRKTRTNMADPTSSPTFQSYWQAWRDAFASVFKELGLKGDAEAAATRCVDDHCRRNAFPDAAPAIQQLSGAVPLAIMSNADDRFLKGTVEHNGWTAFDPVISSETARAYKPDPRAFQVLCEAANVAPEDVVYVGDSAYDDVHGAKLVGMRTVLVVRNQHTPGRTPPPDAAKLLPADQEITLLTELPGLLDSLG